MYGLLISQFLTLTLYFFTMVKKQKKPTMSGSANTLSWALEPPELCEGIFLLFCSLGSSFSTLWRMFKICFKYLKNVGLIRSLNYYLVWGARMSLSGLAVADSLLSLTFIFLLTCHQFHCKGGWKIVIITIQKNLCSVGWVFQASLINLVWHDIAQASIS